MRVYDGGGCAVTAVGVVAAGGSSRRMGFDKTVALLGGVPLLTRTLQRLLEVEEFVELIAAVPPGSEEQIWRLCLEPYALEGRVRVVAGGPTRLHSVWEGVQAVRGEPEVIAIHDGARPFVAAEVVRRALHVAWAHGGALVAHPMIPTVKRVREGRVVETLDRTCLWCAATPQAFRFHEFVEAYQRLWATGGDVSAITDDAQIFERVGGTVVIVESNPENIKLTTPFDWQMGEWLVGSGCAK